MVCKQEGGDAEEAVEDVVADTALVVQVEVANLREGEGDEDEVGDEAEGGVADKVVAAGVGDVDAGHDEPGDIEGKGELKLVFEDVKCFGATHGFALVADDLEQCEPGEDGYSELTEEFCGAGVMRLHAGGAAIKGAFCIQPHQGKGDEGVEEEEGECFEVFFHGGRK